MNKSCVMIKTVKCFYIKPALHIQNDFLFTVMCLLYKHLTKKGSD